jgi:Uncharacterized protein conserved in bacteria (DUF2141)
LPLAQILGSVTTLTAGRTLSLSPVSTDDSVFTRRNGGFALPDLRKVAIAAAILASTLLTTTSRGLAQAPGRLSMTVTGLRSNDGVVRCALHNSPAAFPKAGQEWRGVIAPIRDRQATCVFSGVPAGNYAVASMPSTTRRSSRRVCSASRPRATAFPIMPPAVSARRTSMLQLFATTAETWRCRVR